MMLTPARPLPIKANTSLAGRVALVTGGNRGLGREVCLQLAALGATVVLTSRDIAKAENAAATIQSLTGSRVIPYELDVTKPENITLCSSFVLSHLKRLDILINNAGVYLDRPDKYGLESTYILGNTTLVETFETNFFGVVRMINAFLPFMKEANYGRIVNISSGMGRFFEMDKDSPFYRTSKTAVNALTRIVAADVEEKNIIVNAVCPGWIRTDMGGEAAVRSVEEGARGVIFAATLSDSGIRGALLRDGENFGW